VYETAFKITASAEAAYHEPSHALSEHDGGDRLLEDEGTTNSSSSIGQQQSLIWETEDSDAPPCMWTGLLFLAWLHEALHAWSSAGFDCPSVANVRIIRSCNLDYHMFHLVAFKLECSVLSFDSMFSGIEWFYFEQFIKRYGGCKELAALPLGSYVDLMYLFKWLFAWLAIGKDLS
jgi:hypothetical protein